jgi:hypothetical protein
MAIGVPYAAAVTVSSTATSASDTITTTAPIPVGDSLFLGVSVRLNANLTLLPANITNDQGLSLTPDVIAIPNGGQNGNAWLVRIRSGVIIPLGTTFTTTYVGGSPTRHQLAAFGVPGVEDATPDANHIGTANGTNTAPSATTAGSTPAAGDLAFGLWTHTGNGAQNETGTPTAGFTELQDGPFVGGVSPFLHQYWEYEILPSGGAVTSAPTFLSNVGGWLGGVFVFRPAGAPPLGTLYTRDFWRHPPLRAWTGKGILI